MRYNITRDENGKPVHVCTDNGYMIESRKFDERRDGWMEDQLDPRDFPMIRHGQDMEYLVSLVNALKRENFNLKQDLAMYRKAAGF